MNILSADEIRELMKGHDQPCVSLYMPTHRRGREIEQDPIRLKNLLRLAEERIVESGMRAVEAARLLQRPRKLLENSHFWRHQSVGLAIFLSPDTYREYRLPTRFEELVVVADRYHIKPLLPMITTDGRYYLLVFSQNEIRLFQGSRDALGEIDIEGVPTSLADTLDPDKYRSQLQFYTGTPSRGGGRRDAVFHGTAVEDETKDRLLRWFQQLDKGLRDLLQDSDAPLVLAGVDYILPIARQAIRYPHLMEQAITGNYDDAAPYELHDKAWTIALPWFHQSQNKALERLHELLGTGSEQAATDIETIVKASVHGRVAALMLAEGRYCWGSYDPESDTVSIHQREQIGVEDLLDFTAMHTLSNKGEVFVVQPDQLPKGAAMAAVFRY
jgi:hypothetical protein